MNATISSLIRNAQLVFHAGWLAVLSTPATASTVLSNLGPTPPVSYGYIIEVYSAFGGAVGFRMPPGAAVRLDSVTLTVWPWSDADPIALRVELRASAPGDVPADGALFTFPRLVVPAAAGPVRHTVTTPLGPELLPGATYWLVIAADYPAGGYGYDWESEFTSAEPQVHPPTGLATLIGYRAGSTLPGGAWRQQTYHPGLAIHGTARPVLWAAPSSLRGGGLAVTNLFTNGICTLLAADEVAGPWCPAAQAFTTCAGTNFNFTRGPSNAFFRALAVELVPGRVGFTNLVESYNLLTTIAGAGGADDDSNKWLPQFENGPATNALLSGPHIAMADDAGNIFIADKNAHAVRKVRRDGVIVTVAGTNAAGNAPDEPTPGTEAGLNGPNGLWVRPDGTVYILDLGNGKVRALDTNGLLRTLFTVPGGILVGRGLWVSEDESLAYLSSLNTVKKWTPSGGVTNYAADFTELGNLVVDPAGRVVVTDRGTHSVWRLFDDGTPIRIAGNGLPTNSAGGGDGGLATAIGLDGVRGVWFLPSGAFFVATHRGSQVWHVDAGGFIHLFLNGHRSGTHAGDGTWFWNPSEYRVSECRAVTLDRQGNLLVTEHDAAYVRRVQFLRRQALP